MIRWVRRTDLSDHTFRQGLETEAAARLATASGFDNFATASATIVLVEQAVKKTAEAMLLATGSVASASGSSNFATTSRFDDFATASWLSGTAHVAATVVLVEQLVKQSVTMSGATARLSDFTATCGSSSDFAAASRLNVATCIVVMTKQLGQVSERAGVR